MVSHFQRILIYVVLQGWLLDIMPVTVYKLAALLLTVEVTVTEFEVVRGPCHRTGLFQASKKGT